MKNDTLKIIAVAGGLLTFIAFGYDSLTVSDSEIKSYITKSLLFGCKPIVDVCTSDCGKPITYEGNPECLANGIIRADPQRVQDLYIELGKDLGVKEFNLEKLPDDIRIELEKKGSKLEVIKEDLAEKI